MNTYALPSYCYTWKNVMLWGTCRHHYEQIARENQSMGKVVHCSLAAAELLPIIGQIASIFEKIIVKISSLCRQNREIQVIKIRDKEKIKSLTSEILNNPLPDKGMIFLHHCTTCKEDVINVISDGMGKFNIGLLINRLRCSPTHSEKSSIKKYDTSKVQFLFKKCKITIDYVVKDKTGETRCHKQNEEITGKEWQASEVMNAIYPPKSTMAGIDILVSS